jgi:hypothetical protein
MLKAMKKWRHVLPQRPYKCVPKLCYNTEDSNLNLSGLVNTRIYRKYYSTRAEGMHIATVFALSLYSVVIKNIALHQYKSIRLLYII